MHSNAANHAAEARTWAQDRLLRLGGAGGVEVVERLDRINLALKGVASLVGAMPAVDAFDPDGIYSMLSMLAEDVERASLGITLMNLGPSRR